MKTRFFMALAALSMTPALAYASEAEAETVAAEGGSSLASSPIVPVLGEFIPMLIAFLVLLFVLNKFAWPVITKALDSRAENIEGSLKKAEEAKFEAEALVKKYEEQLAGSRKEAAEVLEAARKAGEAARADIVAKANVEAAAIIERAHAATDAEKRAATAELEAKVGEFAVAIAAKLIGEKIAPENDAKLIDRYLAEMGSFNDN